MAQRGAKHTGGRLTMLRLRSASSNPTAEPKTAGISEGYTDTKVFFGRKGVPSYWMTDDDERDRPLYTWTECAD